MCTSLCVWFCVTGPLKWKENLAQKAAEAFYKRQQSTPNLRRLVYGDGKRAANLLFCNWSPHLEVNQSKVKMLDWLTLYKMVSAQYFHKCDQSQMVSGRCE